jgi:rfaE bifunctional protein nucleotidyltransferase chain/domain
MTHLQVIESKIHNIHSLNQAINLQRLLNKKIVFTNGCFDLLHQGHINYLTRAADLGDYLVVAVNADSSVKQLGKSASRPIQDQYSRALIIAALHFVKAVIIFEEATPFNLIQSIQPNVLVKGGDWKLEEIVGYDLVKNSGGEVHSIDFLPGFSTTSIENKIKNA